MNSNCSNLLDMRNLQEQVKKAFCYQKLFWPFTVWINCSRDLKFFGNSRPSASNFKSFSRFLEQFFLTAGQNNLGNKIPFIFNLQEKLEKFIYLWLTRNLFQNCTFYLPSTYLPFFHKGQCENFRRQLSWTQNSLLPK